MIGSVSPFDFPAAVEGFFSGKSVLRTGSAPEGKFRDPKNTLLRGARPCRIFIAAHRAVRRPEKRAARAVVSGFASYRGAEAACVRPLLMIY